MKFGSKVGIGIPRMLLPARRLYHGLRQLKITLPRLSNSLPTIEESRNTAEKQVFVPSNLEYAANFFKTNVKSTPLKEAYESDLPASLLPVDKDNHFPYKNFPRNLPTPYEVLNKKKQERIRKLGLNDGPERLSVSSLSPGWCELRKLYDIYLSYEKIQTEQMLQGTQIHEKLEVQSHPVVDTAALIEAYIREAEKSGVSLAKVTEEEETLQADISTLIANDPSFPIAEQVSRLLSLFTTGHAREIRVVAFINLKTFEVLDVKSHEDLEDKDDLVMASGIIDHLIFKSSENPEDWSLQEELLYYADDLDDFFVQAPEVLADNSEWPSIIVSDIKTRGWRSLPKQLNVLRANEFQALCYRKFLGIMGGQLFTDAQKYDKTSSLNFCYYLLVENMQRRGLDIDKPVPPELILHLLFKNQCLIPDAVKLKEGTEFGFPAFDNHKVELHDYDLSNFKDITTHNKEYHILDEKLFEGPWVKPFTIRFLLFRLAQFYELMEPYLANKCSIEYLLRSGDSLEPFKTTYHQFKNETINLGLRHAAEFYLSDKQEKIDLIDPKSFKTYCEPSPKTKTGGCRYREWCGWYQEQKLKSVETI